MVTIKDVIKTRAGFWATSFAFFIVSVLGINLLRYQPLEQASVFPPCFFHSLTGLFCTGCGVTRALRALAHLDLQTAWSMNPLAIAVLPLATLAWFNVGLFKHVKRPLWFRYFKDARLWAFVIISFTILRNIPFEPFLRLAPI